jgi:NAD kinase
MTFHKILCILKTGYEVCQDQQALQGLPKYKQEFLLAGFASQQKAEQLLRQAARNNKLEITFSKDKNLKNISYDSFDLILTLGGDGTFLTAAQYSLNTPILGINSFPHPHPKKGSIGALTSVSINVINEAFAKLQKNEFTIEKWPRLSAEIDGQLIPGLAVNEIFFGPVEQDKICDFKLILNNKSEIFPSGGIIISTSKGSTSWYQNAGGNPFENSLGFLVREPNKNRDPTFTQGLISLKEETLIETGGGQTFLSFDSRVENRYFLKNSDKIICIKKSEHDLPVISF